MAMYGLAIFPLIEKVSDDNLIQKWYADDGNAAGSVEAPKVLLSKLKLHGSSFGYNVIKCHFITKAEFVNDAKNVFKGEEVDIIDGSRVLGSVIGNVVSCRQYIEDQKQNYLRVLQKLAKHAKIAAQNVYKFLTNSVQHKLTFLSRTTPDTFDLLEEADETYRDIFSLPVREGGLNIIRPEVLEYERSKTISEPLSLGDVSNIESEQLKRVEKIRKDKSVKMIEKKSRIKNCLNANKMYAIDLASEKGAPCWLNAMPLKKYLPLKNFNLSKSEFRDGIALRYGWEPPKLASICVCGEPFTVAHALHCPRGGYTHLRHNDIRDSFANLLEEICFDVEIEPNLLPLQGESFANKTTSTEDDARLDTKANDLWDSRFTKTFFDVKIFNPFAKSCPKISKTRIATMKISKKLKYEPRVINVEKGTFSPLIFSCTGGAGPSATRVIKQAASKLSLKNDDSYANIITFIRTKISFALLWSSVLCLRGSRSLRRPQPVEASMGAVVEEGRLLS